MCAMMWTNVIWLSILDRRHLWMPPVWARGGYRVNVYRLCQRGVKCIWWCCMIGSWRSLNASMVVLPQSHPSLNQSYPCKRSDTDCYLSRHSCCIWLSGVPHGLWCRLQRLQSGLLPLKACEACIGHRWWSVMVRGRMWVLTKLLTDTFKRL